MLLPMFTPMASFDQPVHIEHAASPEWVHARLHRHPMTRHLVIRVRQEGEAIVLEGHVPTRLDRQWAGSVATHALAGGELHNRLLVIDDLEGPLSPVFEGLHLPARMAA